MLQTKQIQEKELEDLKIQFQQIKEKKENLTMKGIKNDLQIEDLQVEIKKLKGEVKSLNVINIKEKKTFEAITSSQKSQLNISQMQSEDCLIKLIQNQDQKNQLVKDKCKLSSSLRNFKQKYLALIIL